MSAEQISLRESSAGGERAHLQDVPFSASRCYAISLDAPSIGMAETLDGQTVDVIGYLTPPDDGPEDEVFRAIAISVNRRTRTYSLMVMEDGQVREEDVMPVNYAAALREHRFSEVKSGFITAVLAPAKKGEATRIGIGMTAPPAKRQGVQEADAESGLTVSSKARVDELNLVLHRDAHQVELLNKTAGGEVVMAGRRRRRMGFVGRAGVLAAAGLTFASGGLADKAIDPFQDARNRLEQTLGDYRDDLGNAPDPEAVKRVARTMGDLDGHNADAINARAQAFQEQNKDDLIPDDAAEHIKKQINQAPTNEAVIEALNNFTLAFFGRGTAFLADTSGRGSGIKAFDPATPVSDTKRYAMAMVEAYAPLPQSLIKGASLGVFYFGSSDAASNGKQGRFSVGLYTGTDIQFPVLSADERRQLSINNYTPSAIWDDFDLSHHYLHELGHAYQPPTFPTSASERATLVRSLAYSLRHLVDRPADPSRYSAMDNSLAERDAEFFARAFNVTRPGLAHPDESRKLTSPSNLGTLAALARFEARFPGLTDYIVWRNGQSGRNWLSIGH